MVEVNKKKKTSMHLSNTAQNTDKQQGIVLVVSLVFLAALTAVASALMLNSTTDMKMSGASADKVIATQEAYSAIDEIIYRQVKPTTGSVNTFALPVNKFKAGDEAVLADLQKTNAEGDIAEASIGLPENDIALESSCPHSRNASSTEVFTCNVLQVRLKKIYGRKKNSSMEINAGIAQQLLR